eukprot:1448881-Prymnesium_polylepis.1
MDQQWREKARSVKVTSIRRVALCAYCMHKATSLEEQPGAYIKGQSGCTRQAHGRPTCLHLPELRLTKRNQRFEGDVADQVRSIVEQATRSRISEIKDPAPATFVDNETVAGQRTMNRGANWLPALKPMPRGSAFRQVAERTKTVCQ